MSSDSEMSDLSERSSNTEEGETEEEEDEDVEIIYSQLTPYQDEPLAEVDASDNTRDANDIEEGESDEDGLTAATLEARYERETPVNLCSLNSSFILGFYAVCCREVTNASVKMAFNGSIEQCPSLVSHPFFNMISFLSPGPSLVGRLFKMCRI